MKKKVMVVLCASSAINYIEDIRNAGYEPVILEPSIPGVPPAEVRKELEAEYAHIKGERPAIYAASPNYGETLEMVRTIAPCCIIPGTDFGLELATTLTHDLGLPGNNPERLPYMREKDKMQEAVKAAGLRSIRGKVVTTVEEGIAYFREELKGKSAIVKPLRSAGSRGVVACLTEEELCNAIADDIDMVRKEKAPFIGVLVQERIVGTEYFVNTVTMGGQTVVTNVVRYDKMKLSAERPVYVSAVSLQPDDALCQMLMDYVVKVVNATGLEIGPTHTEVMVDEDGPVLIEVNARLAGACQPAEWQDQVLGLHESDIALRAYLGKDIHTDSYNNYKAIDSADGQYAYFLRKRPGYFHVGVNLHDFEAEEFIGKELIESLSSTFSYHGFEAPRFYEATKDFFTAPGLVYLVNDSAEQLQRDHEMLLEVEMNHMDKLFKMK
ncbi:MAG: ATP-grasp domain-containing protein [Prevotella sp.]|nr:ATP-grasp domain-containing protein [Prevotella sp.]